MLLRLLDMAGLRLPGFNHAAAEAGPYSPAAFIHSVGRKPSIDR